MTFTHNGKFSSYFHWYMRLSKGFEYFSSTDHYSAILWNIISKHRYVVVSGSSCPCENGQWMSGEQECDQLRFLGVSLRNRRGPDVPLPARAHLSALCLPLNGTLALDHLLFLHAWVALGLRGKNVDRLSPLLLPGTLMSQVWLLLDCSRFPLKVLTWKAGWALRFIPWPVIQD